MQLVLYLVAALVPLIITPRLLFHFDVTPKILILLIGTSVAALLLIRETSSTASVPKIIRLFIALLGIYGLTIVLASALSTNWKLSVIGTNWRRYGAITQLGIAAFALLVAIALAGRPDFIRLLLRWITATGIPAAAYGMLQYFGIDPWLPASGYLIGEGEWAIVRPPGTLGHASFAATFYLFSVFTGVALTRTERVQFWRYTGLLAAALGSLAIVLSGTRAAMLGLLAGALVAVAGLRPRLTRAVTAAALVLIALTGFYFSPTGQKLRSRARWFIEDPRGGPRLLLWRDSLSMAAVRPITGWGIETFSAEFPRFQSQELARAYPDFYYESPHNIFIDAFVSTGIAGLAALAALCCAGFYAAWRIRPSARTEASCLAAALLATLVAQQFTAFIVPTAVYFYMTIAVLIALACPNPIRSPTRLVSISCGTILGGVFITSATAMLASDYLLARAANALYRRDITAASELERRSREWQPLYDTGSLWYSRALARFAQGSKSVIQGSQALRDGYAAAERATRHAEDRHNAFYNLATYCALRNDPAGVETNLRRAIEWAPNWFKPHWTLAQFLKLAGRIEEAAAEAAIAVELDGGKHAEVSRTLADIRTDLQGH